jgi:hypothetical protein
MPFHGFLQESKCRLAIPAFGHVAFQDFAFVIDRAPEVMLLSVDLHEDLVQVPSPLRALAHRLRPLLSDL